MQRLGIFAISEILADLVTRPKILKKIPKIFFEKIPEKIFGKIVLGKIR